ncbi:sigma-B regulation protein RsbQ [Pedobacter sp. W3I1]|uniref:alpha/beta fold hydrolase n=1 Tax=Pedobacter sp. W3I1 TaxID=3042291 RepID=UPI002783E89E|nr:alpha/beta hydrolase [Pedobacter sp. W3I1]MDQ0638204.1 sigma-B regulation protein RsbQ [Pedobacter sp. W3I1]
MHPILIRNNVKILGEGSQVIVFAHGFGCAQTSWKFITDAFLKDYKVILFDYVGSGDSDLSQYDQRKYATLEGYACDVIDIIEALDLNNIIFVGHSVSSMIGMIAALQMPEVFKKLVFIGPSPRYLNDRDYIGGFNAADIETIFEHIADDYIAWSKQLAPVVMNSPLKPHLTDFLQECFEATDPSVALAFAMATFKADYRDKLKNLGVPSLTLQSTDDIMSPLSAGEFIHKNTPDNFLVVMKATGHFPHISEPEETIREIKDFIEDISLKSASNHLYAF